MEARGEYAFIPDTLSCEMEFVQLLAKERATTLSHIECEVHPADGVALMGVLGGLRHREADEGTLVEVEDLATEEEVLLMAVLQVEPGGQAGESRPSVRSSCDINGTRRGPSWR